MTDKIGQPITVQDKAVLCKSDQLTCAAVDAQVVQRI